MKRVWLFAALVATVTCLQYPLMAVYREVWTTRFPSYTAHWPNDGPLALVGGYGTDNLDELIYAAMVQEVSRRWFPRDPFTAGAKVSVPWDYLPFAWLGLIQRASGDVTKTWFVARCLACVFWFVGLFHIARRNGLPDPAAFFCATFGTAFAYLVGLFFLRGLHWSDGLIRTLGGAAWTIVSYGRTENVWRLPRPGVTYPALFAAALLWYRAGLSNKPSALAAAGLAGGILCWVRLDVSSGLLGAMMLYPFLRAAATRRWDWRPTIPALVTLPIGLPVLKWALNPGQEFLWKAGMTGGGGPDYETALYLPLVGLALTRRRDATTLQTCALLLTVFAICWLPLVTGKGLYTPNWRAYGNIFAFVLALSLLPRRWLENGRVWRAGALATLLLAASLNVLYAGLRYPWQGLNADYAQALAWLKANAADEAVVAALSPEANGLIPAFTRCKTLMADGAPLLSQLPLRENAARARAALKVFGVEPRAFFAEALRRSSTAEPREKLDRLETDWSYFYTRIFTKMPKDMGKDFLERASDRAFPIHYVWTGPFERSVAAKDFPGKGLRTELVYANATVRLDRVLAPMPSSSGAVPGELFEPGLETP